MMNLSHLRAKGAGGGHAPLAPPGAVCDEARVDQGVGEPTNDEKDEGKVGHSVPIVEERFD